MCHEPHVASQLAGFITNFMSRIYHQSHVPIHIANLMSLLRFAILYTPSEYIHPRVGLPLKIQIKLSSSSPSSSSKIKPSGPLSLPTSGAASANESRYPRNRNGIQERRDRREWVNKRCLAAAQRQLPQHRRNRYYRYLLLYAMYITR